MFAYANTFNCYLLQAGILEGVFIMTCVGYLR